MIEKINTILAQLPPNWMSRVTARSGQAGASSAELRKLLGEPLPRPVDLKDLPKELAALFATYGMLQKIKRKLEWLSRRRGNKIIPAKNTVACIDDEDNIYVGVDFLKRYHRQEDVIAGVMAHEWGHMISDLAPGTDLSHLSWDELFEIRREEEADADAYAGRALYLLGYKVDKMVGFVKKVEEIEKKVRTQKYHSPRIRAEILKQAYKAQENAEKQIQKLFNEWNMGFTNPTNSRLIAVG